MASILIGIILLHFLFASFKSNGSLYCGLFGGCFNRPIDEIIKNKLKILGMVNQSRGEHSCGYFNGSEIKKGFDDKKKFIDLLIKEGISVPDNPDGNLFIGHTRHATYGAHTEENAHPFNIDDALIVAHNGTISNIWSLMSDYQIPSRDYNVDSKGLAKLLKEVGYEVLNKYEGHAALLIHKIGSGSELQIYHGASRDYEGGAEFEERPLFYLIQQEGVYVSSIEYALSLINDTLNEVKKVPHNAVFTLKDGKFLPDYVAVDRGASNVKKTTYWKDDYFYGYRKEDNYKKSENIDIIKKLTDKYPNVTVLTANKNNILPEKYPDPYYETLPVEATGNVTKDGKIFFRYGRYWIVSQKGLHLADGAILANKKTGEVISGIESAMAEPFYFFKGVRLRNIRAFQIVTATMNNEKFENISESLMNTLRKNIADDTGNFAQAISHYSDYPVCLHADDNVKNKTRQYFYCGGKFANSAYTPKFSSRDYVFREGRLVKVVTTNAKDRGAFVEDRAEDNDVFNYDNVSEEEISENMKFFNKTFANVKEIEDNINDIQETALLLYVEDLCKEIMNIPDPTEKQLEEFLADFYKEIVDSKVSIKDNMTGMMSDAEQYIMDAIVLNSEEDEDEDVEEKSKDSVNGFAIGDIAGKDPDDLPFVPGPSKIGKLYSINHQEIDEDIEREVEDIQKATDENERAEDILDNVYDSLNTLLKLSFELSTLNNSTFAENTSQTIQSSLDSIASALSNDCYLAKQHHLGKKFNQLNQII